MGEPDEVSFVPTAAPDVLHVTFNPSMPYFGTDSPLSRICAGKELLGYALHRVVSHTQHESVAVFVRAGDVVA